MAEPRVVVANREDLWWLLAEASQLEHMIMCQYLFAEFSLKQGTEEGLTGEQAAAALGISPSTADRHWVFARAWLRRELGADGEQNS